jgi:hypothetical protein
MITRHRKMITQQTISAISVMIENHRDDDWDLDWQDITADDIQLLLKGDI